MRSVSTRMLTGTVLKHRLKPLATWVSFIRLMRNNVPVEFAAELCGVTHKTAFEWRHRVLATVSGYQDRIVPRDTVWVDETYINDTDLSKGYGQARKRDLPRQKLCACVAIDVHKNSVAVVCGHDKPNSACVREAMGGRIAPGALLTHDLERAHNALVRDGGLESKACRADVNDPVYLERMEMVNDLCSWHKRYLWRFTGMSPQEPAGLPRLVRLPLQGRLGLGQIGPDYKGGAPCPDGRRDLPQLGVGAA